MQQELTAKDIVENLEYLRRQAVRSQSDLLHTMREHVVQLQRGMSHVLMNIDRAIAGEEYNLNTLGEVKWLGDEIDRKLALLGTQRDVVKQLTWALER